ncbi:hypothetical protein SAMN05216332_101333 [Nitrosospira briensis]|nr:hypothetical protein SAMN05216332_101333 [Nitrosospira briensis]
MILDLLKIITLMCGRVQSVGSRSEILHFGVRFFLPLVVDATGPAQANYSLPGLFYLPYPSHTPVTKPANAKNSGTPARCTTVVSSN